MEQLTYFDGGKWRLKIGDTEYSGKAVDRLAAYEDTGLEPCDYSAMAHALEQAERAREDLTEMIRQIGATGLDIPYSFVGPLDMGMHGDFRKVQFSGNLLVAHIPENLHFKHLALLLRKFTQAVLHLSEQVLSLFVLQ